MKSIASIDACVAVCCSMNETCHHVSMVARNNLGHERDMSHVRINEINRIYRCVCCSVLQYERCMSPCIDGRSKQSRDMDVTRHISK